MSPTPNLAGKTAVVTGASSGIGRAIAETLGAAGAHVFLAGRTQDAMDASRARIEAAGGRGTVVVLDVRDVRQVQALVDRAVRETGRLSRRRSRDRSSRASARSRSAPAIWCRSCSPAS